MSAKQQNKVAATFVAGGMRAEAKKSRVVFKAVLDMPYNIPWPEISAENNTIVLDILCDLLNPIRTFHLVHAAQIKEEKRKIRRAKKKELKEKEKQEQSGMTIDTPTPPAIDKTEASENTSKLEPPAISKNVIIGINAITKALERSIQDISKNPPPSAVFVCKGDLSPTHLYSHFGTMIAMLPGTLLFPLTKGSEKKLAAALGMPAVGAVAIQNGTRDTEDLVMVTSRMVDPIRVSWLPKVTVPSVATPASATPAKNSQSKQVSSTQAATAVESEEKVTSGTSGLTVNAEQATSSEKVSSVAESKENSSSVSNEADSRWIPTNIKMVKSVMPIIVDKSKPKDNLDGNGKSKGKDNSKANNKGNSKDNGKGKMSDKQVQPLSEQMNKAKKHSADASDSQDRGKSKLARKK
ncbi:hypothetical protein BGZ94_000598 [Podila epigama]|nr:hypothetical protein BGZ94_000598 [Podila epigama]